MAKSTRGVGSGAGGKMCTKGKSCGATCIDARERCELELGPLIQAALPKVVEQVEKAQKLRKTLVEKDLSWSDEDAAKWLKANTKSLENAHLKFEGGPGTLWTFGIEPGMASSNIEKFSPEVVGRLREEGKLGDKFGQTELIRVLKENPAAVVRITRMTMEDSKMMNKATGTRSDLIENIANPRVVEKIKKGLNPSTMSVDEEVSKIGSGPGKVWTPSTYMAKAATMAKDLGIEKWSNGNMSNMSAPDVNIWPFGDVFKRAGMNPGVFESRDTWMKHMNSANRTGAIAKSIISQKPEKVFLGGTYGANIMKSYIKELQSQGVQFQVTGKVVNWTSKSGQPKTSNFAIVTTPNTKMVFGPHFTAQVPKAVSDMRTALLKGDEIGDPVKTSGSKPPKEKKSKVNTKQEISLTGKKPNGTFTANDVWAEAAAYAPGRVKGWTSQMRKIRDEIRAENGGSALRKGPMVDEFRNRAVKAGLVPSE